MINENFFSYPGILTPSGEDRGLAGAPALARKFFPTPPLYKIILLIWPLLIIFFASPLLTSFLRMGLVPFEVCSCSF